MKYSKIVNFDLTEAGLTSKWGKISPAVQWCYQNQSNYTVQRCASSYDVATLNLMAPMDFWRNFTPFWCKAILCTIKIDNFRICQLGHHMFCLTNKKTASFWWANGKTAGFFMSQLGYCMICSTNKQGVVALLWSSGQLGFSCCSFLILLCLENIFHFSFKLF